MVNCYQTCNKRHYLDQRLGDKAYEIPDPTLPVVRLDPRAFPPMCWSTSSASRRLACPRYLANCSQGLLVKGAPVWRLSSCGRRLAYSPRNCFEHKAEGC